MPEPDLFAGVPEAVIGCHKNGQIGSDIELFNGELELKQGDSVVKGLGQVCLSWHPSPAIRFSISAGKTARGRKLFEGEWTLHFSGEWAGFHVEAEVTSYPMLGLGDNVVVKGRLHSVELGVEIPVRRTVMQIANLTEYMGNAVKNGTAIWKGRVELSFDGWNLKIDSINEDNLSKNLKQQRGFALTHNCEVTREDGQTFMLSEVMELGAKLHEGLSFCCGRWTGPVLFAGYDQNEVVISQGWVSPRLSKFTDRHNWFSFSDSRQLKPVVEGVLRRSVDVTWKDAVKSSIYWYINASIATSVENGIVLQQIVFELLGWMYLVEDTGALSSDGYKSLKASDKLRLLLSQFKISPAVPDAFKSLSDFSSSRSADGPEIVTMIRNSFVHPGEKNREFLSDLPAGCEYQAWELSAHYVELIMRAIFEYQGNYVSRVVSGEYAVSRLRAVPWSENTVAENSKR